MRHLLRVLSDVLSVASDKCEEIADGCLDLGRIEISSSNFIYERERAAFRLGRDFGHTNGPEPRPEPEDDEKAIRLVK